MMKLHVGNEIKKICIDLGVKQVDLAEKLGRQPTSIARDLRKRDLSTKALRVYCDALGIEIRDLFQA